jgi:integrase
MDTITAGQRDLTTAIINRKAGLSVAAHEVACRRPLVDVVEATITAAARSRHTARAYQRAIGEFTGLLATERADFWGAITLVTKSKTGNHGATVYNYHDTPAAVLLLVDAPLLDKFATQQNASSVHAVRTFLAVSRRDNILTTAQAAALGVSPYRQRVKRKQAVTGRRLAVMEVQILRQAVDTTTPQGKRDLVILDLMLLAGLRREEVARLRLTDFTPDNGRLSLAFTGKGDKRRKLFVNSQLYKSLAAWLEVYPHQFGEDAPAIARIFKGNTITTRAVTPQAVGDVVSCYGALSGLATATGATRLGAHDLRRTFARRAYDCGAGLPAIQLALGHADPKTTAKYIGLDFDDAATVADLVKYS